VATTATNGNATDSERELQFGLRNVVELSGFNSTTIPLIADAKSGDVSLLQIPGTQAASFGGMADNDVGVTASNAGRMVLGTASSTSF